LLAEAMALTGLSSETAVVERGLRGPIGTRKRQNAIQAMTGLGWEGDLDALRQVRSN
jgi:Arc/MetJ family transcription regulator